MSLEERQQSIDEMLPSLFECSPSPQGGFRVRTPLVYPDGGIIDVFVMDGDGDYSVTDLGETLGWLRMQSIDAGRTAEQTRIIEDTCARRWEPSCTRDSSSCGSKRGVALPTRCFGSRKRL